jgi:cytochrome c-type biogenesis protein CcmH/NrfG
LQPGSPKLHCNLGNALLARRNLAEAAQEYQQALRLDPNCEEAAFRLKALAGRVPGAP